jgi:hypothetical protein
VAVLPFNIDARTGTQVNFDCLGICHNDHELSIARRGRSSRTLSAQAFGWRSACAKTQITHTAEPPWDRPAWPAAPESS